MISKEKLKELKIAFIIILKDYNLTKFEVLKIADLLSRQVEIRTERYKVGK